MWEGTARPSVNTGREDSGADATPLTTGHSRHSTALKSTIYDRSATRRGETHSVLNARHKCLQLWPRPQRMRTPMLRCAALRCSSARARTEHEADTTPAVRHEYSIRNTRDAPPHSSGIPSGAPSLPTRLQPHAHIRREEVTRARAPFLERSTRRDETRRAPTNSVLPLQETPGISLDWR